MKKIVSVVISIVLLLTACNFNIFAIYRGYGEVSMNFVKMFLQRYSRLLFIRIRMLRARPLRALPMRWRMFASR